MGDDTRRCRMVSLLRKMMLFVGPARLRCHVLGPTQNDERHGLQIVVMKLNSIASVTNHRTRFRTLAKRACGERRRQQRASRAIVGKFRKRVLVTERSRNFTSEQALAFSDSVCAVGVRAAAREYDCHTRTVHRAMKCATMPNILAQEAILLSWKNER